MTELTFEKYIQDPTIANNIYKIGIVGAQRRGKTSLITTLLNESNTYHKKSGISIVPYEENGQSQTQDKVSTNSLEIDQAIKDGSKSELKIFKSSTASSARGFIFHLVMSINNNNNNNAKLNFALLDYLGQWLSDLEANEEKWNACQEWIRESSVLIVIVDSNLVMEADSQDKVESALKLMETQKVKSLVEDWAKNRRNQQKSALLIFVPVKCESYFNDNGGEIDESLALYKRITNFYYKSTIQSVKSIFSGSDQGQHFGFTNPKYTIEYHPVDTIGCIEIARANWVNNKFGLTLNSEYLLRYSAQYQSQRKPLGSIDLLTSICKQISYEKSKNIGFFEYFRGLEQLMIDTIERLGNERYTSRFKLIDQGYIAVTD